jgi:dihydroorotate dehydrogenase electron transfer subunit
VAEPDCNSSLPGAVVSAVQHQAHVVAQTQMARDTYCLRLHCPPVAEQIHPGQFFMVRLPETDNPLLGRPFALYDVYEEDGQKAGIDFGYVTVGKLTSAMTEWKSGQPVELWGPLGNGFPLPDVEHLALVAGGIGQTPFLAVAREALGQKQYGNPPRALPQPVNRLTMCYGARSADYLAGLDDFQIDGLDLKISTDDGSQGHHGFVTELLAKSLESNSAPQAVYCCGPEPMMKAVQQLCAAKSVPCWLSLETPMACGFGICFSCVTRVKLDESGDEWDYRRTCVEGPVFPAEQLLL